MSAIMSEKDEIIMSLVHYFITEENYTPIIVNGAKDEIWLENMDAPYKVVRINSNRILNEEQFKYDVLKTKSVLKQIKKRTFSFSMNILNIFLDINKLPDNSVKNMDMITLKSMDSIKENKILTSTYKKIMTNLSTDEIDLDAIIRKTEDVNKKTEVKNKIYEDIFKPKPVIVTYIIMFTCILYFIYMFIRCNGELNAYDLVSYGANYRDLVKSGEWYRLFSSIFLHASILHIFFNMYALKIIGSELETYIGKFRFILVFLISGLVGSLFSAIFTNAVSVGASGAIYGVLGALLYFSYHYRIVLGGKIFNEILPVIILNLIIGLCIPGIDISAHIGGLVGGIFTMMAVGVPGKKNKTAIINGSICLLLLLSFLSYIVFCYIK